MADRFSDPFAPAMLESYSARGSFWGVDLRRVDAARRGELEVVGADVVEVAPHYHQPADIGAALAEHWAGAGG